MAVVFLDLNLKHIETHTINFFVERHSIRCCDDNGRLLSNNPDVHCFPITIPEDDPVFSKFHRECMNFVRSTTDQETGCNAGNKPAEQVLKYYTTIISSKLFNLITSVYIIMIINIPV